MLVIVERVVWVLAALVVLTGAAAFALLGPPPAVPKIQIETRETDEQTLLKSLSADRRQIYQEQKQALAKARSASGSSRAGRVSKVREEFRAVLPETVEHYSSPREALNEAQRISSEVIEHEDGSNSLRVFGFSQSDPIAKLGFEENDVVDLIDGQKIDFSDKIQGKALYDEVREKIRGGFPVRVTVTRNGAPMDFVFGSVR